MKVIISVVMTMLLSVPLGSLAEARQRDIPLRPPVRCNICAANGLSQAVVTGTFASLNRLQAKLKAGQARSTDVRESVGTLRIFFAHLDETGVTKAVEQSILSHEEELIKYSPTYLDAERVQKHHAALGVQTTVEEHLRSMEALTVNDRMRAIALVRKGGLHPYYASVISRLENLGDRMANAEKTGSAPLRNAFIPNCDYDVVSAIFGVICVFGCLGCCVVAAISRFFQGVEC